MRCNGIGHVFILFLYTSLCSGPLQIFWLIPSEKNDIFCGISYLIRGGWGRIITGSFYHAFLMTPTPRKCSLWDFYRLRGLPTFNPPIKWVVFRPHFPTFFCPFSPRLWVDQEIRDSLKKDLSVANRPILWFDGSLFAAMCGAKFIEFPNILKNYESWYKQLPNRQANPKSPPVCWTTYSAAADDEGYWSPPSRYRGRCLTSNNDSENMFFFESNFHRIYVGPSKPQSRNIDKLIYIDTVEVSEYSRILMLLKVPSIYDKSMINLS